MKLEVIKAKLGGYFMNNKKNGLSQRDNGMVAAGWRGVKKGKEDAPAMSWPSGV